MSEAVFIEGLTKTYRGKTAVECMLGAKQADSGTVRGKPCDRPLLRLHSGAFHKDKL